MQKGIRGKRENWGTEFGLLPNVHGKKKKKKGFGGRANGRETKETVTGGKVR